MTCQIFTFMFGAGFPTSHILDYNFCQKPKFFDKFNLKSYLFFPNEKMNYRNMFVLKLWGELITLGAAVYSNLMLKGGTHKAHKNLDKH